MKALNPMSRSVSVALPCAFFLVLLMLVFGLPSGYSQEPQPPAQDLTPDPWPRTADVGGVKYTIYQPQIDKWDGYQFEAHAAVSVLPADAKEPLFGAMNATAVTQVDRVSRAVSFYNVKVVKAIFPSAPDKESQFRNGFQAMLSGIPFTTSLDRLQEALAVGGEAAKARAVPVVNEPPKFIFSQTAAVLIYIDGEPVWRTVQGTKIVRVLNTRALILGDTSGRVYLHLFDGFLEAPSLSGPWTVAKKLPTNAEEASRELAKERVIDLMEGPPDEKTKKRPSLKKGFPRIIVTTTPTELILTEGPPDWVPIQGTMLLYVKNTTGNIFKDLNDQYTYVLVTGRWFRAPDFTGSWQYVDGKKLPVDFANIPDDSPKENVKASVPGTPQAQAAVIATEVPQTARVDRTKAKFTSQISGNPDMKPIPGTPLSYVSNSPTPIIMAAPYEWYAVDSGVWFTAPEAQGPWFVAESIPPVIYSIPPSSPVYYATYVKVYDATPEYVVEGYTPGYMGTVVTSDGVAVYGTGYTYTPYVGPTAWYGPPVTYGYAANPTWTPWTGWTMGFGMGWGLGAATSDYYCYTPAPYWGAMPYAPYTGYAYGAYGGAAPWGPAGWAATSGDVYQKWGPTTAASRTSAGYNAWTGNGWSDKVGTSYNSVTGRISAGQRASVGNVYTGNYAYGQRGATYNPNTGVEARGGTATYGNARTGEQNTVRYGQVSGPGGRSADVAKSGTTSYYAGHDGSVYRNTGSGWESNSGSGWNSVPRPAEAGGTRPDAAATERPSATPTAAPRTITITNQSLGLDASGLDAQQQARQQGDQRSAASSWGSKDWGGGFSDQPRASGSATGARATGPSASTGWDRGSGGDSFGGGDRSWGGGDFGGGDRSSGGGGFRGGRR